MSETTEQRLARLERENAKLRKINTVLIDRVERSMDFQGNAFSLFQTAILLEGQVRDRTQELEQALQDLARSNHALSQAKEDAETARIRLAAAIEAVSEGFILCDAEDRLVLCNEQYRAFWPGLEDLLRPGTPFAALVARAQDLGLFDDEALGASTMQRRLRHHRHPEDLLVLRLADGRWIQIRERPTAEGGSVAIYTDITALKHEEQRQLEASEDALRDSEQRIRLITDALPALIAYVDRDQRYRFTNKPYEDWFGRPRSEIDGRPMRDVLGEALYEARRPYAEAALAGRHVTFETTLPLMKGPPDCALATYVPHYGADGRVQGFIALIQDITERKRSALQLREAKESLERRVEERTSELTTVNRRLQREVEERRQAEEALRLAKAEAEAANMSKTKFIAAASHDLLQPLNAARIFTEALTEAHLAERNRAIVGKISRSLTSVEELLTALLDISKLDSGAQVPQWADFQLDDLLSSLADEIRPQALARGLDLRILPCRAVVRSDPVLVRRILRNFLSNAMRYTPVGRILLGGRRRPGGVAVQVWDSGIGIPADKLSEVFQEFRRLANDSHDHNGGMGLGLAIVDRIARRLDHAIEVRSQPAQGSMFGVVLPLGRAERVSAAPAPLPSGGDGVAGALVLVIENDGAEREGMAALLQNWGCHVLTAADREEALHQLRRVAGAPVVVVADYHLDHDRTGLDAVRAVRAATGRTVPAIILTADRSDAVGEQAAAAGCQLLNKPLRPARLRALLAHFKTMTSPS